jgi:quercetin dioxygenase-like cupin family protein
MNGAAGRERHRWAKPKGRYGREHTSQFQVVGPGDAILIPPGAWHTMHDSIAARRAVVSRLAVVPALRDEGWLTKAGAPPYAHEDTYLE